MPPVGSAAQLYRSTFAIQQLVPRRVLRARVHGAVPFSNLVISCRPSFVSSYLVTPHGHVDGIRQLNV